jgi:nitrogenase subunit NifH
MFEVFLSVASQTESVLYINDTRSEIINAIPVINSYFKSLLESQYETQYYDISSDVDVLKKLANSICSEQSEIVNTDQA